MDSASSWMRVEERTEYHPGRSEAKGEEGWVLSGSGRVAGEEAEGRIRAIPTSGSLGIGH